MRKKIRTLLLSQGIFESIKTLIGSIFATTISAISLMIYSRVLGPEKFGEFSVGFAIVLILTRINDVGLNNTILRFGSKKDETIEKNFIYSFTLKYKMVISLCIIIFTLLFFKKITNSFNFSNDSIILLAMTLGLVTVYYEHLLSTLQSLHRFNQGIIINIIQASIKLIGAIILLAVSSASSLFAFSLYIFAPVVPVLFWKKFVTKTTKIDFQIKNDELKSEILKLAKHSSIGLIAAGIIENIDILYLQKYLTTYEVGLYSGISRISLLFSVIAYSFSNVLYPRVAKYQNKSDISVYIKKALMLAALSVVGFLVFIPFGKLAILLTIGTEYLSGINVLYLLTASSFIAVAAIPFIALFYSFNANWYFSISGIIQLTVVLVGNTIFVPIYGLEAAAWTRVATRLSLFLFVFATSMILYKKKYGKVT